MQRFWGCLSADGHIPHLQSIRSPKAGRTVCVTWPHMVGKRLQLAYRYGKVSAIRVNMNEEVALGRQWALTLYQMTCLGAAMLLLNWLEDVFKSL